MNWERARSWGHKATFYDDDDDGIFHFLFLLCVGPAMWYVVVLVTLASGSVYDLWGSGGLIHPFYYYYMLDATCWQMDDGVYDLG